MLLYHIASKIRPQIKQHIGFLAKYVTEGKLDSEVRVNAALEYLISNASSKAIVMAELDQACGVGVVVTPEQIENAVEKVLNANKDEILEKRYRYTLTDFCIPYSLVSNKRVLLGPPFQLAPPD
jgi:glutaminyl-tRNA synthetase